jgi:hypothetical protein
MTVKVHGDGGPDADWWIEVPDSYPDEVKQAAQSITDQVRTGLRGQPRTESIVAALERGRAQANRAAGKPTDKMRKALMARANELLLNRQDRLDLAENLLDVDCQSWSDLSFEQTARLLDAMEGYVLIRYLRIERHGLVENGAAPNPSAAPADPT